MSMFNKISRTFSRGQSHLESSKKSNHVPNDESQKMNSLSQHFLPPLKYPYSRPAFLNISDLDELDVALDKVERPILTPKDDTLMPFYTGYAEVVNAGKSSYNEDQACATVLLPPTNLSSLTQHRKSFPSISMNNQHRPSLAQYDSRVQEMMEMNSNLAISYFGLFDGHAGFGSALYARNNLHKVIKDKMVEILPELKRILTEPSPELPVDDFNDKLSVEAKKEATSRPSSNISNDSTISGVQFELNEDECSNSYALPDNTTTHDLTVDDLLRGLLESAFTKLDNGIEQESRETYISGGCTALVALGFNGSMYVANAGDCRAIAICNGRPLIMSRDHTPRADRIRILSFARNNRKYLGRDFHYLEFPKRIQRKDLGKKIACRHSTMTGWIYKTINEDDLRVPLVCGEGRKGRLMSVIGVARGFGDFNLRVFDSELYVKPFMTCEPEIRMVRATCNSAMLEQCLVDNILPTYTSLEDADTTELSEVIFTSTQEEIFKETPPSPEVEDFCIVPPLEAGEHTGHKMASSTQTASNKNCSTTQTESHSHPMSSTQTESIFSTENIILEDSLTPEDVLILGTDGLWDVCTIEIAKEIVSKTVTPTNRSDKRRYIVAAHELASYARGMFQPQTGWRTKEGDIASGDDISVFVVPLIPAMYPHHCVSQSQL